MPRQADATQRYDRCVIPYADPAALIDDPLVLRVAITDNGEPLVDSRNIAALAVDQARTDVQQLSDNPFQVRAEVAERLVRAQASLPVGYQLQVKEGWHPLRPALITARRSRHSASGQSAAPAG